MTISTTRRAMSARRNERALLLARPVPRRPRHGPFAIHIVNVGAVPARAASWRIAECASRTANIEALVRDLPGTIAPGETIPVATVDPRADERDPVDVIVRWIQPSGMVDESIQRIG